MKFLITTALIFSAFALQAQVQDSTAYKKKVLDRTELSWISSFYNQDGSHAAVTGGEGIEKLTDVTSSVIVKLPIKQDGVLTIDAGLSAYSSASSSNVNPFDGGTSSGASGNHGGNTQSTANASPWVESSGPSKSDVYSYANLSYAHSSDDRNRIWSAHGGFSTEFDYTSLNFGLGYAMLFNEKNTSLELKASAYLDNWKTIYPTELKAYYDVDGNLNSGFFSGVDITPSANYDPSNFTLINDTKRNSFSGSLMFSQVLSPSVQVSVFGDVIYQTGLLSTPFHRIYFADKEDYYIQDFQLADDREKLPDNRLKTPIGMRLNAYISDRFMLRTYYRFYTDDWDLTAHTAQIELPIKISQSVTIAPQYRYYTQTAAKYFAPMNTHLSTEEFYTSDYDLSKFSSNQIGGELKIAPPFGVWKIGKNALLKSIILRYQNYQRNIDFNANIATINFDFTL